MELAKSRSGHDVETTANATQTMSHLKQNPLDMALLGIEVPGADGFTIRNRLNQKPDRNHLPLVGISARDSDRNQVTKAIQMGATDFPPRNFQRPVLKARIKGLHPDTTMTFLLKTLNIRNTLSIQEVLSIQSILCKRCAVCFQFINSEVGELRFRH